MGKLTLRDWEHVQAGLPGQAFPSAPHWIVMGMSRHKERPMERRRALFFRHPTAESAAVEAARLSALHPGKRFSVYGSGPSFKVELPVEAIAMAAE